MSKMPTNADACTPKAVAIGDFGRQARAISLSTLPGP